MEANPVRILQYFDGEKQSVIPLFQRPYTWEKKNWQTLWDDILNHYGESNKGSPHFMSAVVSIPAKSVPVGVTKHLIIDGQQRLTTIAILLCALRDTLDDKNKARVQDFLVNRHHEGLDHLKLLPTQGDRSVYYNLVKGDVNLELTHKIMDGYIWFLDALKGNDKDGEPINAQQILETVTQCLQVVMINLGEADDPYQIFESLNYKGEPLTQADLVRNFVLMRFNHSLGAEGEQERVYKKYWLPLETQLAETDQQHLLEFLRHYASRNGENVLKPKVYATIKRNFEKLLPDAAENELKCMFEHGALYGRFIWSKNEPNDLVRAQIDSLNRNEISVSYPLLLRLFESYNQSKLCPADMAKCLGIVESYIVRRAVLELSRSSLNKVFIAMAGNYPNEGGVLSWLQAELSKRVRTERWPDDIEFEKAICFGQLYNTKGAKLVLGGVERFLEDKEQIDIDKPTITIEHVMPQQLTNEWEAMLGEAHEEIHREYLHTIGNLTLTGYNSELSNLSFAKKRDILIDKSGMALNRWIANQQVWNKETILERARYIAKIAMKIWTGPNVAQEKK
jgi:uncharacterized protein with ParB-like and HNH nuclease domain